jgi:hypothetical protein
MPEMIVLRALQKVIAERLLSAIALRALPEAIALKFTTFSQITIPTKY